MTSVAAVVLCGGTSLRMGVADKTALPFAGSTVLDHLLDSLPEAWPVVCVGPERPTARTVTWTREVPTGGGPVAGMAAGLALVRAPVCVLLAGDLPFAGRAAQQLAERLLTQITPLPAPANVAAATVRDDGDAPDEVAPLDGDAPDEVATLDGDAIDALAALDGDAIDALAALDGEGRSQPLLAAYRTQALRDQLPRDPAGARLMGVVQRLRVQGWRCDELACHDVDTPEALALARAAVEPIR